MPMKHTNFILWISLALGIMFSCTKTENETLLPPEKYPLNLTSELIRMQTRSAGKDSWSGGEVVGVSMEGMLDYKKYKINTSGKLEPIDNDNTIYWKNTDRAYIRAWYPDNIQANVDISDQSNGYAEYDFLYAIESGAYNQSTCLRFHHKMAKVEFTLTHGDGISKEELKNASVKVLGDPNPIFNLGMLCTAAQSDGEIIPYYNATTKAYEAVLVPQNMTGKTLIIIGIKGKEFSYTPKAENEGNLQGGVCNRYSITVKATGLEVESTPIIDWNSGGNEDVQAQTYIDYSADEVKAGDYIYEDGSTSDGGLRRRYSGSKEPVIAEPKPQPISGKTVAGIVFWVPKDSPSEGRLTPASLTDDKIMAKDFPNCTHGLAVSLYDVSTKTVWSHNENTNIQAFLESDDFTTLDKGDYKAISSYIEKTSNINLILGYQNTKIIKEYNRLNRSSSVNRVLPVGQLEGYTIEHQAPANSTGWFLPSAKELYILGNKDVDDIYERCEEKKLTENRDIVNSSISAAGSQDVLGINSDNEWYWTSTELFHNNYAFIQGFKYSYSWNMYKSIEYKVRAVCAF